MTEHTEENVGDDDFPIFTTNLNHLIDRGYPRGYADGMDAAREAVAPMEAVVLRIAATLVRHPSEDDLHDALQRHWCGELKAALFQYRAAIDALREDSKTPPPLPPSVGVPERRWS